VNQELRSLISLQELELKITSSQKQIADVPVQVQSIRSELEALKKGHHDRVAHFQELTKKRRAAEGEVDLMRTKLSRLKDQLMAVKTNKEYTAMLHEIQAAETQIRGEEDKILEFMEELELLEKQVKVAERDLETSVRQLEERARQCEGSVPELESELARLASVKVALESHLSEDLLSRFRRLAEARRGVALAEARDELCSACHVRIRPQVYAELRSTEVLHTCDSCSRILYIRD
jgi:hypothetical protein